METVDWFRLLWDLIQRGWKLSGIADRTTIGESTLRMYLNGSQPPHWRGEVLIDLWCQACSKDREQLPMCEVYIAPRVVEKRTRPAVHQSLDELERAMR